jgi:uncharacterized protein DUF6788
MRASQARRLAALERRLDRLKEQLAGVGFLMPGSVVRRFMPCGKPGCRCGADPPVLHGPYWQWSTKVAGKTVTRRLTAHEAEVYGDFVANRRRLETIVAQMRAVSARAAQILAEDVAASATHDPARPRATRAR